MLDRVSLRGATDPRLHRHSPSDPHPGHGTSSSACIWSDVKIFLSHNHRDKPLVRDFASLLRLSGADVWLDEWELEPGDSIPLKVDEGLTAMDTIIVCWSANAAASNWVRTEFASGLSRSLADKSVRVIPATLDDTPLPTILAHIFYLDLRTGDVNKAVRSALGLASEAQQRLAIQHAIEWFDIQVLQLPNGQTYVCCPNCGATVDNLESSSQSDDFRGDTYYGVHCRICDYH